MKLKWKRYVDRYVSHIVTWGLFFCNHSCIGFCTYQKVLFYWDKSKSHVLGTIKCPKLGKSHFLKNTEKKFLGQFEHLYWRTHILGRAFKNSLSNLSAFRGGPTYLRPCILRQIGLSKTCQHVCSHFLPFCSLSIPNWKEKVSQWSTPMRDWRQPVSSCKLVISSKCLFQVLRNNKNKHKTQIPIPSGRISFTKIPIHHILSTCVGSQTNVIISGPNSRAFGLGLFLHDGSRVTNCSSGPQSPLFSLG